MTVTFDPRIRYVPVGQINVLNPRSRGKAKFAQITGNIARLGLKRPVTVTTAEPREGEPRYDLVCGQGRLEAYVALGQAEIPAVLASGTREELMLISLAENLARRAHSAVELVREVRGMKDRGHPLAEIARKTDLDPAYVRGVLQLLDRGEERLLLAVEKGHLPVSVAITIATSDDKAVQRALQDAYERNTLRGRALIRARRLIDRRRAGGKTARRGPRPAGEKSMSAEAVLRTFQQETVRQKLVVQRAKICETKLLFAVAALRQLFRDDYFVTLLRAEGLNSLPEYLADKLATREGTP